MKLETTLPASSSHYAVMRMNANEALGVVAELRQRVLARQRFRGYSGLARAGGGTLALVGAAMVRLLIPDASDTALVVTWGVVFCLAFGLNYGAVVWWRMSNRATTGALSPALEPLPILLVGGVVTAALIHASVLSLLPGVWMCLFGLTQFSAKYAMPQNIRLIGWYYIAVGIACLWFGEFSWREPLIMGGVFFMGEWSGGLILHS
ncbi:MAG: hypothetical protein LBV12_03395, partial [Puniceicoccales bacterium]|nr:hypothetical protein [Puniceicoccales bacterium]